MNPLSAGLAVVASAAAVAGLSTAMPETLVLGLLEQQGPLAAAVGVLYWRVSKLEERVRRRLEELRRDVDLNSQQIEG